MKKRILVVCVFLSSFVSFALPTQDLVKVENLHEKQVEDQNKRLVLFWSSWCSECKDKMTRVFPKIKERDFEILTVNTEGSEKRVQHYVKKNKIEYPVYLDKSRELQKTLKIFSVPSWAVYSKNEKGEWSLLESANAFEADKVNAALGTKYF